MMLTTGPLDSTADRGTVAPVWHTIVLLAVFVALTALGAAAQRAGRAQPQAAAAPPRLVMLQVQAIVFEWLTLVWVWFGVRKKGVRVRQLISGRWLDAKSVVRDVLLGGGLWLLWIGISWTVRFFLGQTRDAIPYPANLLETVLAVAVAVSAGFCEEIVFRGYLLKQFQALTGSTVAAVLLQAAVFGLPHIYQGLRLAAMAALYGILFAVLALWRRSLRPGILAHAWSDIAVRVLHV
jgi:CAAX protease family protein